MHSRSDCLGCIEKFNIFTSVILNNYFYNVTLPINNTGGVNTTVRDNQGYLTENYGTTSAGTEIEVIHHLAGTPNRTIITPLGATNFSYVHDKTATTFNITSQASVAFDWYAVYEP